MDTFTTFAKETRLVAYDVIAPTNELAQEASKFLAENYSLSEIDSEWKAINASGVLAKWGARINNEPISYRISGF